MKPFIKSLKSHCLAEISSARTATWWTQVRGEQTALRRFDSIATLRHFFELRSKCRCHLDSREQAVRALVHEYRAGQATPCFELLFVLYRPLLAKVATGLRRSRWRQALERDEIESEVVHTFLNLLATLNLETNRDVHTSLCRRIRGSCFEWARREFQARTRVDAADQDDPPNPRRGGWELDLAEHSLDELLHRRAISARTHRLFVDLVVHQQEMKTLARGPANENANEGARIYEATKKRRQRGLVKIRAFMMSKNLTLVGLAIASLEKTSISNVPESEKAAGSRERSQRENTK